MKVAPVPADASRGCGRQGASHRRATAGGGGTARFGHRRRGQVRAVIGSDKGRRPAAATPPYRPPVRRHGRSSCRVHPDAPSAAPACGWTRRGASDGRHNIAGSKANDIGAGLHRVAAGRAARGTDSRREVVAPAMGRSVPVIVDGRARGIMARGGWRTRQTALGLDLTQFEQGRSQEPLAAVAPAPMGGERGGSGPRGEGEVGDRDGLTAVWGRLGILSSHGECPAGADPAGVLVDHRPRSRRLGGAWSDLDSMGWRAPSLEAGRSVDVAGWSGRKKGCVA